MTFNKILTNSGDSETWYNNEFSPSRFKRLFAVMCNETGVFRGWHGHKVDEKAIIVVGCAEFGIVNVDDWDSPSRHLLVNKITVSDNMINIPSGTAIAYRSLSPGTVIMFFSTLSMDEIASDDYRYPNDYWVL